MKNPQWKLPLAVPILLLLAASLACGKTKDAPLIEDVPDTALEEVAAEASAEDDGAVGGVIQVTTPDLPSSVSFTSIEDPAELDSSFDILGYSAGQGNGNLYLKIEFAGPLSDFTDVEYLWDPSSPDFDIREVWASRNGGGSIYMNGKSGSQLRVMFGGKGYVHIEIDDDYDGMSDRDLATYFWHALNDNTMLIVLPYDLFDFHQAQSWITASFNGQKDLIPDRYMVEKYRLELP